jgi:phage/plasmid-associated DNA primase
MDHLPPGIVFRADPRAAFWRFDFDPLTITDDDQFTWACPTWAEIGSRMTNWPAFCQRVGSIFDERADRKQAVYVSGPKDSGKSQIMRIIGYIAGSDAPNGGSYATLANEDLESPFWRASLVGARVVCIGEASPKFLCTEAFKAITGDSLHNINQKNKPMCRSRLNPLFFFFSNDLPAIESKPDLIERVIDCRLKSLPEGVNLVGDEAYQSRLRDELPAFLGYCMALCGASKGSRIECDRETLQEAIDEHEQEAINIFETCFKVNETGWIESDKIEQIVRANFRKMHTWEFTKLLSIWKRRYGLVPQQGPRPTRKRGYRGIEKLPLGVVKTEVATETVPW